MKKIYILAALLLATTSAHAGGISFQINGERVRIEAPSNCNAISCVKVISPGYTGTLGNVDLKGMGKKKSDDDDVVTSAPAAPPPAPAPVQAAAPPPPAPAPAVAPAPTTVAAATPLRYETVSPAPLPPAPPAPAAAAPVPAPAPVAAVSDPNSPVGTWMTEENKGNVRIEECGANLCGYAVNTGARILINMKP